MITAQHKLHYHRPAFTKQSQISSQLKEKNQRYHNHFRRVAYMLRLSPGALSYYYCYS